MQIMSQEIFKAPKSKRPMPHNDSENWSPVKKKKMKEFDFLSFCNVVLQYTKYESMKQEELRQNNTSPLDSGGSVAESFSSESTLSCYTDTDENSRMDMMSSSAPPTTAATRGGGREYSSQSTSPPPRAQKQTSRTSFSLGDDDDDESITCFCLKPYGGRPMIQCEDCMRWIHYSCAKIRKNKVPDIFICQKCRDSKAAKRKSNRMSTSPSQPSGEHRVMSSSSSVSPRQQQQPIQHHQHPL